MCFCCLIFSTQKLGGFVAGSIVIVFLLCLCLDGVWFVFDTIKNWNLMSQGWHYTKNWLLLYIDLGSLEVLPFVALSFGFAIAESSPSGFASRIPINLSGKIAKAKHNKKQKTCDNDIYEGEPT